MIFNFANEQTASLQCFIVCIKVVNFLMSQSQMEGRWQYNSVGANTLCFLFFIFFIFSNSSKIICTNVEADCYLVVFGSPYLFVLFWAGSPSNWPTWFSILSSLLYTFMKDYSNVSSYLLTKKMLTCVTVFVLCGLSQILTINQDQHFYSDRSYLHLRFKL